MLFSLIPASASASSSADVQVKEWWLILGDDIGLNFRVQLETEDVATATASIDIDGTITNVSFSDLTPDESGCFTISAHAAAPQMNIPVLLTILSGENIVFSKEYSVRSYADYILDPANGFDAVTCKLVRHMLNYGGTAQEYFDYHAEELANKDIAVDTLVAPAESTPLSVEGNASGITYYGASLLTHAKTVLRIYFRVSDPTQIDTYTFWCSNTEASIVPQEKSGYYYIDVEGFAPHELDRYVTVNVSDGTHTLSVCTSPLNYITQMYAKGTETQKAMLGALYNYHLAAKDYLAADNHFHTVSFLANSAEEAKYLYENNHTSVSQDTLGSYRFINRTGASFTYAIDTGSQLKQAELTVKAGQKYQKIEVSFNGVHWVKVLNCFHKGGAVDRVFNLEYLAGFQSNSGQVYVRLSGSENYAGSYGLTFYGLSLNYSLVNDAIYMSPVPIDYQTPTETGSSISFKAFDDTEDKYLHSSKDTGQMTDSRGTFRFINSTDSYMLYGLDAGSKMEYALLNLTVGQKYRKIQLSFDEENWTTVLDTAEGGGPSQYRYDLRNIEGFADNAGCVYVRLSGGTGHSGCFGITFYELTLDYTLQNELPYWTIPQAAQELHLVQFSYSDTAIGDTCARILQGVINRRQARVYIARSWSKDIDVEPVRQEILKEYGAVTLKTMTHDNSTSHKGYSMFWTIFNKYYEEIERLYVFTDTEQLRDTINVAAMLAGRNNGVAVDQQLADQIIAAGYDLPVIDVVEYCGFTGENGNALAINRWISENLTAFSSQELVIAATPTLRDGVSGLLPTYYDFAVATNSLIYDASLILTTEGRNLQADILEQYQDNTPVIGWPGLNVEEEYVSSVSQCGKTVVCVDWGYDNGSVWAAFPQYTHPEPVTPIPKTYELKDGDVYVSFMVSDGDAWHFTTGDFLCFWNDPVRGTQPIGWTIPVLFTDYNPLMLEYIYDTATPLDNLMQGPSGISYLYPSKTPTQCYSDFLESTKSIFADMGINMVNVWDPVDGNNTMIGANESLLQQYIDVVQPDAIFRGHDSLTGGYKIYNGAVLIEEMGNMEGRGAMNAEDILRAIDHVRSQTPSNRPVFIAINVEAWGDCVNAIAPALEVLSKRSDAALYHVLTPAELIAAIKTYENVE